jgi:hypothetical protein
MQTFPDISNRTALSLIANFFLIAFSSFPMLPGADMVHVGISAGLQFDVEKRAVRVPSLITFNNRWHATPRSPQSLSLPPLVFLIHFPYTFLRFLRKSC